MKSHLHQFPVFRIGGVPLAAASLDEASQWLLAAAENGLGVSVRLSNTYSIAASATNQNYLKVLRSGGVNFADGTPVAKLLSARSRQKSTHVRGPSLFLKTLQGSKGRELGHYFLGGTDGSMARLRSRLEEDFPDVQTSGLFAPPFGDPDAHFYESVAQRVRASHADVLWVGMGSPKQDFVTSQLAQKLEIPCIGVGAAFDFFSGTVSEAPLWIQRTGLEWAHRFSTEPRRLWRRYVFGTGRFILTIAKNWKHDVA